MSRIRAFAPWCLARDKIERMTAQRRRSSDLGVARGEGRAEVADRWEQGERRWVSDGQSLMR